MPGSGGIQRMLINGASFPHKAQRPTEGREIMYAEFTGAVGCCCRAGGHLWSEMIAA